MEQKVGAVIALLVFAVIGVLMYFNLQRREPNPVVPTVDNADSSRQNPGFTRPSELMGGIESPIGDEVERNGMLIAAAWLPPIQMEGRDLPQHENVIHLEADIHALKGNRNGFGLGAWIPYLTVTFEIKPLDPVGESVTGELYPMVAKDGPHYGATLEMPGSGKYQLIYHIDNPSKKNFGRHRDPVTGVDPWWDPFEVTFDFDFSGKRPTASSADSKSD